MATVKLVYRKNTPLKNGSFPVVIRLSQMNSNVTHIRVNGVVVNHPNEWNNELSRFTKAKKNYKKYNKVLTDIESKADDILSRLLAQNKFSYQRFKDLYLGNIVSDLVFDTFNSKIQELLKLGKYGTVDAYTASRNALKQFMNNDRLTFSDIDYRFLTSFEHHLRLKGNAGNTISYKIRSLRALHYNYCNTADISLPTAYRKFKVGRLSSVTVKRSLNQKELKRFLDYTPVSNGEDIAKETFIFSLLTRGMNVADIAFLKKTNLVGNKIIYKRAKTSTIFTISITHKIQSIIDKYNGNDYLFPIINPDHKNTKYSIRLFTKQVNKYLQKIADKIEIPKITTYYARYTFSALARDNGIPIELISQALGHSDLKTTEIYMNSFSDDKLDNITETILASI